MNEPGHIPRVLHVVGAMNLGGTETMLMNLYRTMDRRVVQFDFLVFTDRPAVYDEEIVALGGRIFRMNAPSILGYGKSVSQLEHLILAKGPFHAVHAHIAHASTAALRAGRKARVPIRIAHAHNSADLSGRNRILRFVYYEVARRVLVREATILAACGEKAGRFLFGRQWLVRGVLIRNSIHLDSFLRPSERGADTIREGLGIGARTLVLGSIASMETVKNHAFLLDIARLLSHRGVEFRLLLVGVGSLRSEIQAQVKEAHLENEVIFLGQRRDVPALLRSFDVNLLPSHNEGLPTVLIEAQASGTPSLVSDHVTTEADLGLGLLRYEKISSAQVWTDIIEASWPAAIPSSDVIRTQLAAAGYDVQDAARQLIKLYGIVV